MPPTSHPSPRFRVLAWSVLAVLSAAVLVLVWMPPFLAAEPRAALMHAFHFVCHQAPERSLQLGGIPLAVCHRCLGIYTGFAAGALVAPLLLARLLRIARFDRILLGLSLVPLALDWTLGATGVLANSPGSRALTGLLFGLAAGLIAGRGLAAHAPHPSTPRSRAELTSA